LHAYSGRAVARVTQVTDNRGVEIAFFDLDKTIIARSSPLALGRSFFREGLISRSWLLKSVYAQLMFQLMGADEDKMEKMREQAAKMTEGWEVENVRRVVGELLHDHRSAGRLICIVSTSPDEIVRPLADMLLVDRYIASRPKVIDGRYTGELEFYAYGASKAEAMAELAEREGADLAACYAYSDSVTDLPMLEAVGHPVAVNPDKELRKVALEREWRMEDFRKPVSLRDRLPELKRPEMTVSNGVVAALGVAGVAGLAWWVTRKTAGRSE
jgi:HAD superfamily hydrolase (TIGR01490 family)